MQQAIHLKFKMCRLTPRVDLGAPVWLFSQSQERVCHLFKHVELAGFPHTKCQWQTTSDMVVGVCIGVEHAKELWLMLARSHASFALRHSPGRFYQGPPPEGKKAPAPSDRTYLTLAGEQQFPF